MNETLKWMIENYATVISVATILFGVVLFFRKWVYATLRSINFSNSFHDVYGENPVEKIKEIHDTIRKSHNTLEIRQSISEKYLQIGIFMCEPEEGKCLWSNDFLNEFFGLDSSKMKGYGWLSVVDSQDRDNVYEVWTCSIKNGTPYSCQYNITNQRTGEKSLIEAFATAVLNDSDKIVCYVGWVIKIK